MSDMERAVSITRDWFGTFGVPGNEGSRLVLEGRILHALGIVRLQERAAIVDWLRAEADTRRLEVYGLITGLSDDIERGKHETTVDATDPDPTGALMDAQMTGGY